MGVWTSGKPGEIGGGPWQAAGGPSVLPRLLRLAWRYRGGCVKVLAIQLTLLVMGQMAKVRWETCLPSHRRPPLPSLGGRQAPHVGERPQASRADARPGLFGEVKLYNRALSAEQVQEHYRALSGPGTAPR